MGTNVPTAAPLWARLVGGTDLSGDDRFTTSDVFSGALLLEMTVSMVDLYFRSAAIDFGTGRWESLTRFVFLLAMCFAHFAAAGVISLGNSNLCLLCLGRLGVLLSPVLTVVWFGGSFVAKLSTTRTVLDTADEIYVTLQVGHAVALILMLGSIFFPLVTGTNDGRPMLLYRAHVLGGGQDRSIAQENTRDAGSGEEDVQAKDTLELGPHVVDQEGLFSVLPASSDLQWDQDDLRGFECAAGIPAEASFFHEPNRTLLVGPDAVKGLISFVYPRPFDLHNMFLSAQRRRSTAQHAHIRYPIRLLVALVATVLTVTGFAYFEIVHADRAYDLCYEMYPGLPSEEEIAQAEQNLEITEAFLASLTSSSTGSDVATAVVLRWVQENPEQAQQCTVDINMGVPTNCISDETFHQQLLYIESLVNLTTDLVDSTVRNLDTLLDSQDIFDTFVESIATVVIISVAISLLITYWFSFVAVLAFRKNVLELSLSSPSYPFSPAFQHCAKDQKFVACISVSLVLSFFFLQLFLVVSGLILKSEYFWKILADYVPELVAFCIYETLVLAVVPMLNRLVTLDKHRNLVNPRRQALLIFVWEIFYFPQVALSILCKVLYCICTGLGMLLRPDAQVLAREWVWLDSMHASYVASLHTQIVTSQLKLAAVSTVVS